MSQLGRMCRCGARTGRCPECKNLYQHGTTSHYEKEACKEMNAPVDCVGG